MTRLAHLRALERGERWMTVPEVLEALERGVVGSIIVDPRPGLRLQKVESTIEPFEAVLVQRGGRVRRLRRIVNQTVRNRVVKGWAFMDLSDRDVAAIRAFLRSGLTAYLPSRWQRDDYSIYAGRV